MAVLNRVWDSLFPFMLLFEKLFFFHVVSMRNTSRTVTNNALIGSDKEEREELPRSPFEIGTEEEEELSGEGEGEKDPQESKMKKMKESLNKMEEKQRKSQ